MNNLAIAYFEWHPVVEYNRQTYKFEKSNKGVDYIKTVAGEIYDPDEWIRIVKDHIHENHLEDLYEQVYEYVKRTCLWLKGTKETQIHAYDCLLHESYKKWNDFVFQEKLEL